jgi:hypothetical protein
VLHMLFRLVAEVGPRAIWLVGYFACLISVFVLYVGIAMWATLCAHDPEQQKIRYQVFRDLRDLFLRGKRS